MPVMAKRLLREVKAMLSHREVMSMLQGKGSATCYPDEAEARVLSLEDIHQLKPEALRVIFWVMDSLRYTFPEKEIVGFNFSYNAQGLREVELEYLEQSSRVS